MRFPSGPRGRHKTLPSKPTKPTSLDIAHRAQPHAGAAAIRGVDRSRADQPVLPQHAGSHHARRGAARIRPAGVVPAAERGLAQRVHGEQPRRRPDPARLRRLRELCRPAAAAGRDRRAFRHLGPGHPEPAGQLPRPRKCARRAAGDRASARARSPADRLCRRRSYSAYPPATSRRRPGRRPAARHWAERQAAKRHPRPPARDTARFLRHHPPGALPGCPDWGAA